MFMGGLRVDLTRKETNVAPGGCPLKALRAPGCVCSKTPEDWRQPARGLGSDIGVKPQR